MLFDILNHAINTQEPLSIVSAMITPGILILAAGSLISSTLLRLARVVDRTRVLIDETERLVDAGDLARAQLYSRWLSSYSRRTVIIERTLQSYYISIAIFVASTLTIALTDLLGAFLWLPPILVVSGICLLFSGTAALVWETSLSTGSLRQEIAASNLKLIDPAGAKKALAEIYRG